MQLTSSSSFRPLLCIFCIVLMEFIAFGMIIPLSPYLARDFGADDLEVGLLMSVYSLAQLIFAPFWGYLSDHFGRRPVILFCLAGSCLFYLWFAFATTLSVLFLTRILAGIFGAIMSISMACIADITSEKSRSKNMGLVGAGIGLGFVIGPALGAGFGSLGRYLGDNPPFGSSFVALGAFFVCVLNFLFVFFFLKESFKKSSLDFSIRNILLQIKSSHQSRFQKIFSAFRYPVLKQVLMMYFLLTLALAGIESSLFLYVRDKMSWTHFPASIGFTYIGLMMVFTQGFLVRKLIPLFGERNTVTWGLVLAGIGFAGVGFTAHLAVLSISVTLLCVGYGIASTSLSGAVSLLTGRDKQGGVFGVQQSMFSIGRILGPALGGLFYRDVSPSSPFFMSGVLAFFALGIGLFLKDKFPKKGRRANTKDVLAQSIDLFQLENLVENQISFLFFNLDPKLKKDSASSSYPLLRRAENITNFFRLEESLKSKEDPTCPVVLICETGKKSKKWSLLLQKKGFLNVFFLEGGSSVLIKQMSGSKDK